ARRHGRRSRRRRRCQLRSHRHRRASRTSASEPRYPHLGIRASASALPAASLLRPPTGQGYETLVDLDKSQAKASSCLCESWSILDFMVCSHILHLIFTVCTPRAATEEMYRSLKNIAAKRSGTIVPAVTLLGAWGLLLTQHPMDPTATGVVIWWS